MFHTVTQAGRYIPRRYIPRAASLVLAVAALAAAATPAQAISFSSTGSLSGTGVSYSGTLVVSGLTGAVVQSSATLTITLTNTTPSNVGGVLTGFAFNNPTNITNVTLTSNPANFGNLLPSSSGPFNTNAVTTPGNLAFDIGVGTGNNFQGGNPQFGLPTTNPDTSGTWVFGLTGTFNNLTNAALESLILSTRDQTGTAYFAARFQSVASGGANSDVAITVPEPATMTMAGIGIASMGLFSIFRRRNRSEAV